jgi:hypothetical protein
LKTLQHHSSVFDWCWIPHFWKGKEWTNVIEYFMCKHTKCPKLVSYLAHSQKSIFQGLLNKISLTLSLSYFVSFNFNSFTFFPIFLLSFFEGNEYVYKLLLEVLASDNSLINWDELLSKEPYNIVDLFVAKFIFVSLVYFLVPLY